MEDAGRGAEGRAGGRVGEPGRAAGAFMIADAGGVTTRARMTGAPTVDERPELLTLRVPVERRATLVGEFRDDEALFRVEGAAALGLDFRWAEGRGTLRAVAGDTARFLYRGFGYGLTAPGGAMAKTTAGFAVAPDVRGVRLRPAVIADPKGAA